jgi:hypothetical protein
MGLIAGKCDDDGGALGGCHTPRVLMMMVVHLGAAGREVFGDDGGGAPGG